MAFNCIIRSFFLEMFCLYFISLNRRYFGMLNSFIKFYRKRPSLICRPIKMKFANGIFICLHEVRRFLLVHKTYVSQKITNETACVRYNRQHKRIKCMYLYLAIRIHVHLFNLHFSVLFHVYKICAIEPN